MCTTRDIDTSNMHFFKYNIADYRKDTQHLKPMEHYIYRELIDWYYLDEKPIPLETQRVLRRLRLDSEYNKILENVLCEYFKKTSKGYVNGRCEREIEKYHRLAGIAKVNGSKGGRPKKTQRVPSENPAATQKKPDGKLTTNHKPLTINQGIKEKDTKKKSRKYVLPDIQMVIDYATSRGNDKKQAINLALTFFEYYTEGNWKDMHGNPVKNWKQKFITWESRNAKNRQPDKKGKETNHQRVNRVCAEDAE